MRFSVRRRLCRASFCLVCLTPTLLIGASALVTRTPAYRVARRAEFESRLSAKLGLPVRLARVDQLGWAFHVARGIELRDPESGQWLVRARSAEARFTEPGWDLALYQPEIQLAQLPRLAEILHEHILVRTDERTPPVRVVMSSLALHDAARAQSVLDVRCVVEGRAEGAEVFLEFRGPTLPADEVVRLRLVRNRQLDPPATGWELHTGPTGVACSLLTPWLPAAERLGSEAGFQGSIWCEQQPRGWNVEIAGLLYRVDLDRIITGQFPHKLSGSARIALSELKVEQGRVTRAVGQFDCQEGVVSQSFLDAAGWAFRLERQERLGAATHWRYQHLSFDFSLDHEGLLIAGRRGEPVIMRDSQGPLLSLVDANRLSPLAVVRLLVPDADVLVPATRETAALFRALPLPLSTGAAVRQGEIPYTPLRLRPR
jgi:hypothetical protein